MAVHPAYWAFSAATAAAEACREAIRLWPDDPKAHNNLGAALERQGRHQKAEAAFRDALRLRHDFPSIRYNAACAAAQVESERGASTSGNTGCPPESSHLTHKTKCLVASQRKCLVAGQ